MSGKKNTHNTSSRCDVPSTATFQSVCTHRQDMGTHIPQQVLLDNVTLNADDIMLKLLTSRHNVLKFKPANMYALTAFKTRS